MRNEVRELELYASEKRAAAALCGVLIRMDDVGAVVEQEVRHGRHHSWPVRTGDEEAADVFRGDAAYRPTDA
jgi:hypothetical protein